MCGGCEKVQEWSGDLISYESGVLPSERMSVEESIIESKREREKTQVA